MLTKLTALSALPLLLLLQLSPSVSADDILGLRTKMASGDSDQNVYCEDVDCGDCGMSSPSQFSILVRGSGT